jgi:hypothetical protein
VWISGAVFAVAASWMLHGWLRPRWARLATLVVVATLIVATPWSQGYWGGFVAATGGALLFGAAVRLLAAPRPVDGFALGAGLAILAMSRPWEGLVAATVALAPLGWASLRRTTVRAALTRRAAPVTILVLVASGAWLGYYQWRVTGFASKMPFVLYDETYETVPVFLWQSPRVVAPVPHPVLAHFFRELERPGWREQHTVGGWTRTAFHKTARHWGFYLGGALSLSLAGLPWALRRYRPRWALAGVLALLASQLVIVPTRVHYVAPGACLVAYLAVEGLRHLRLWRRHSPVAPLGAGARLASAVPLALLLAIPFRALALRDDPADWQFQRAALERRLARLPGRQLVIVRYGPGRDGNVEWVANDADLARTRVLWARAMTPAEDCRLVAFERDRTAWLLDVVDDLSPPRLARYPACASTAAAAPNSTLRPSMRQGSTSSRRSDSG